MAPNMSLPAALSPALSGREAIIDALYRVMTAMDTNDVSLLDSAHTEDARWEVGERRAEGLKAIHSDFYERTISRLDTTHYATNIRVNVADGEREASLSALYLAHHFQGGTGREPDAARYTMGGLYYLELVKDDVDGLWKIKLFRMKAIWAEGDRSVMGH